MQYWLLKSEPGEWSWDDQQQAGTTPWDGVKNNQAQKNMRAMQKGDRALFYHSGKERRIVGLVKIARGPYPDPDDETGKRVLVDMKTDKSLPEPVTLKAIKAEPSLGDLALVRQPRLSVMPVDEAAWQKLLSLAGA
jgi:predicted RNA-binding protein with PUA-like domain